MSWRRGLVTFADRVTRSAIATGAYYAVASSIMRAEEPFDDPGSERTVALLDNRSRNYSMPREVAEFYDERSMGPEEPALTASILLHRRASEGVQRRSLVRCRGGGKELDANYDIKGQLGSGAFGKVRKAVDRTSGLQRAIKIVPATEGEDELGVRRAPTDATWERMLTEVEALMELTHPNIVTLHEYYRDDDALYLVEEYCSGGTLEDRLRERGGRLGADEAAVMLRQMLRGVLCCHAHGLAHRDLKPENFVLASRDPAAALKLIDFGLTLSDTWSHVASEYAHMAGTLEYSAPVTFVCAHARTHSPPPVRLLAEH